MADTKLSGMGSPVAVSPSDLLYVVQGGTSKATNVSALSAATLDTYTGTKGWHVIPVLAGSMQPAVTAGCATLATDDTVPNVPHLAFDSTAQEYAEFCIPMPNKVNTVEQVHLYWTGPSSGDVVWSVQTLKFDPGNSLPRAWGTAVTATATSSANLNVTTVTTTVAVGNVGSNVYFRVSRVAGDSADTASADAKLLSARVWVTTNLEVDD
jgi:hypothetical protein